MKCSLNWAIAVKAYPVGIRTNDIIDESASDFKGFRDLQGGHCSVWCDRVVKRQNFTEIKGWAHLNRKCFDRGKL